jgi:hypothetical protein
MNTFLYVLTTLLGIITVYTVFIHQRLKKFSTVLEGVVEVASNPDISSDVKIPLASKSEEAFNQRILRMKIQQDQNNGIPAPELHPSVHNLPHDSVEHLINRGARDYEVAE